MRRFARLALAPSHGRAFRGFTLIELMVVIGIILMLVGLTVGVSVILHRKSETRETENTLKLLDLALSEWELGAERQMSWGPNGSAATYEIDAGSSANRQSAELLARLKNTSASREIISRIDADFFGNEVFGGGALPIVKDAWGKRILVIHPGRLPNHSLFPEDFGVTPDPDGTIRIRAAMTAGANEDKYGVCTNRKLSFISAGPDGEFGDLHLDVAQGALGQTQQDDIDKAADNLYSSPVLKDRAP